MSEIVMTIKAGTGYDVPWIVYHAESVEELNYFLDNSDELLDKVNFVSKKFAQSYVNTPTGVAELIKQELGGTVIGIEPAMQEAQQSAPVEEPKPWERAAQAATPKPWETQASPAGAPAPGGVPAVKLPYVEKKVQGDGRTPLPGTPYALQGDLKNWCYQQRNKLNWNVDRKVFEFSSPPSPDMLATVREWVARLGGSIVE